MSVGTEHPRAPAPPLRGSQNAFGHFGGGLYRVKTMTALGMPHRLSPHRRAQARVDSPARGEWERVAHEAQTTNDMREASS